MRGVHHLYQHIKKYGFKHKALYCLSFLVLFWTIFDGLLGYIAPLIITGEGLSKTMMGIILGTSSIAGMFFDIFLCKLLKNSHIRRLYLILFVICAIYPLMLWQAKTIWMYILVMGVWGIYYDLYNIGQYDFVGRYTKNDEHASSFGVLQVFSSVGYLLAPLFAGFLIGEVIGVETFLVAWIFLGIAFILFIVLLLLIRKNKQVRDEKDILKGINKKRYSELFVWERIGKAIFPILVLTVMLNIIDSTFWTVGPLLVDSWSTLGIIGSLFTTAYLLPPLFVGWFMGPITAKLGEKKTANLGLLLGSLIFALFYVIYNPIILIVLTFLAAIFINISLPANNGTYADSIYDDGSIGTEIEGEADFATNIGCVIGPMLAGVMADTVGNVATFSVVGVMGVIVAVVLLVIIPSKIRINLKDKEKEN